MDPPLDFIDLAAAAARPDHDWVNIIGVVVDLQPPLLLKGGQYMITIKLLDRKLQGSLQGEEGLIVRFFKDKTEQLPKIRGLGDIVWLRSIKMTTFNGPRVALANWSTEFLVFTATSIPNPTFGIAFQDKQRMVASSSSSPLAEGKFKLAEQSYIMHLKQEMSRAVEQSTRAQETRKTRPIDEVAGASEPPAKRARPDGPSLSPKFKLIAELRDKMFADICVFVVKKSHEDYGCDLYVTDYTTNELMRYYPSPEEDMDLEKDGDQYGYINNQPKKPIPGPYGHQILKVNLKPPHAGYAMQQVREDDCIVLRNVKSRLTTWLGNITLEGDMWPDHLTPEQINVRPMKDHSSGVVKDLLARREKYQKSRAAFIAKKIQQQKPDVTTKASKKAEKKARKRREAEEAQKEASANERAAAAKDGKNPHIRCSYEEVRISSLNDILDPKNERHTNTLPNGQTYDLPFINARYRARVRVVDFFPKNLSDFAIPSEQEYDSSAESMAWVNSNGTPKYEWSFSLLLEEAVKTNTSLRKWVHLHHEEAQFLLGNEVPDPEDLRQNSRLLGQLREKLFVLWGNLEENKAEEETSNLPFECCIMEYGVEVDGNDSQKGNSPEGWRREYAIFGTTIL